MSVSISEPQTTAESRISMVLPGGGPAGGVRSTVALSNGLLGRGYDVRLLVRRPTRGTLAWSRQLARDVADRINGVDHHDWINGFRGAVEYYTKLSLCSFRRGEFVVAVGSNTVAEVAALDEPVRKLRHCRGFSQYDLQKMQAWTGPMKTITVASTTIPLLEELSPGSVIGVVPNGKEEDQYYDERIRRDGIGTIYYNHPNKCPEDTIRLLAEVRHRWPNLPQYVFSTEQRPKGIAPENFHRYPPVELARQLYCRSKVWLLTSKDEGMPGPVLEAMRCGSVVISADNYGSRELIADGVTGAIVPVGDIAAFISATKEFLEDEDRRLRVAQAAREAAARYTWDHAVDCMVDALGRL